MEKGDYLFVYGTLRRGERMDLTKQFFNFGVDFCGSDAVNAEMFHLGAYPGVKAQPQEFHSNRPTVYGEVFRIRDMTIVAHMDAYEGYDAEQPSRGLYDRIQTQSRDGKIVWVYVYNHPVTSDQRIESGDWCKNRELPISSRRLA